MVGHLEICAVGVLLTLQFVNYLNNLKSARYQASNSIQRYATFLATGAKFQRAGQMYQAERIYRKVLNLDPTCAPARYRLGILEFLRGKLDLAIKLMDSALLLEPDNGIYCLTLAKVLLLRERNNEATAIFMRGRLILMNSETCRFDNHNSFPLLPFCLCSVDS